MLPHYLWNIKVQICDKLQTPCSMKRNISCIAAVRRYYLHMRRRRQTDTSIFSVWARHTDVAGPALAAVSGTHWLQAGCARLSMPARSGATVSLRSHPVRRRFQPPPSPVVVFLAASDPTYTAVHCRRSCVFGGWSNFKPEVAIRWSNACAVKNHQNRPKAASDG